jgi:predicted DNA-binding protein
MMFSDIWRKLMPRGSSKTLSVIVPVETQERLEKLAKFKRWSVSQTARILIEEGLDQHEAEDRKID